MEWQDFEPLVKEVRGQLQNILAQIEHADKAQIPECDDELRNLGRILSDSIDDLVVCGEVKKGKSSFINALIGDSLLPTNTEVATSQIFRILSSSTQCFSLVFTNGERQEISREELARFGSQTYTDMQGEPLYEGRSLEYIEIRTPIEFLPNNVSIVDTPGIGALYASHEEITTRYLQHASAVVFVLDPANPISQSELAFLDKVLNVTTQVVFVMTKMDNYSPDYISTMVSRNEELLTPYAERIGEQRVKVLPMSSMVLQSAASDDEILRPLTVEESNFYPVRDEVMSLIHRTMGLSRNVYALRVFERYCQQVMSSIACQSKALSEAVDPQSVKERSEQLRAEFVKEWGSNEGLRRQEITQFIIDKVTVLEIGAHNLASPLGPVYKKYKDEIDRLKRTQVKSYVASVSQRLQDDFGTQWKILLEDCLESIQQKLVQFGADIVEGSFGTEQLLAHPSVETFTLPSLNYRDYLQQFRSGYLTAALGVTVVSVMLPVSPLLTLLASSVLTIPFVGEAEVKKAQNELQRFLGDTVSLMHKSLCADPISAEEPYSLLTKAKRQISEGSQQAIESIYNLQKANLEKELDLLVEQSKTSQVERKEALQHLNELRTGWMAILQSLLKTRRMVEQLNEKLQVNNL